MTSQVVFPLGNYSGVQTCAPVTIDDTATGVSFSLDRGAGTLWSQSGTVALAEVFVDFGAGPVRQFLFGAGNAITGTVSMAGPADIAPGVGRQVTVKLSVGPGLAHTTGTLTWQ